jgi:hypothetical protein
MAGPRPTPADTVAAIKDLRSKGFSISDICAATKASRGAVHRHCVGIRLPNGPLKRGPKFKRKTA